MSINGSEYNLKPYMVHTRSPSPGCSRVSPCTSINCLNGGTCIDNWVSSSCNCTAGFSGSRCENQISASFISNVMGMRFEETGDITQVGFKFLISSSGFGILLSTANQVSSSYA